MTLAVAPLVAVLVVAAAGRAALQLLQLELLEMLLLLLVLPLRWQLVAVPARTSQLCFRVIGF